MTTMSVNPRARQPRPAILGQLPPIRRGDGSPIRVLLVDDVMTSGATAHHAAVALREAGAAEVQVLVAARTLPRGHHG